MDTHGTPNKKRYNLTLTEKNIKMAEKIQIELAGGKNISSLLDTLLFDWIKDFKEREIYFNAMQEALEIMKKEKISNKTNKNLTAMEVLDDKNISKEFLEGVSKIVDKNKAKWRKKMEENHN